jgi:hypothetical protein
MNVFFFTDLNLDDVHLDWILRTDFAVGSWCLVTLASASLRLALQEIPVQLMHLYLL